MKTYGHCWRLDALPDSSQQYQSSEGIYFVGTTLAVFINFNSFMSALIDCPLYYCRQQQEAQLMLTNLCDTIRSQSRSPNIVPFHMLGIVSY